MYFLQLENWFTLLTAFFISPQIFHNATKAQKPKFYCKYVFGMLAPHIAYPVSHEKLLLAVLPRLSP